MDTFLESHAPGPGTRQSWSGVSTLYLHSMAHAMGQPINDFWVTQTAKVSKFKTRTRLTDSTEKQRNNKTRIKAALPFRMGAIPGIQSNVFTHSLISHLPYRQLWLWIEVYTGTYPLDRMTDGACSTRCCRQNCSDCNSPQHSIWDATCCTLMLDEDEDGEKGEGSKTN